MIFIYLPPIILFAALIALVVILGKKTVALRKRGISLERTPQSSKSDPNSSRFQNNSEIFKRFIDASVIFLKNIARRAEEILIGTFEKMKERQQKKMIANQRAEKEDLNSKQHPESEILSRIESIDNEVKKSQILDEISLDKNHSHETSRLFEGVIVKRKKEIIPQRIVPELAKEDKVKEDALIHRIAENPKDIEAYREIGDYYMSVGNIKDAKDSFKMVLKLRPRDLKAKSSLREIEMKMRLGS